MEEGGSRESRMGGRRMGAERRRKEGADGEEGRERGGREESGFWATVNVRKEVRENGMIQTISIGRISREGFGETVELVRILSLPVCSRDQSAGLKRAWGMCMCKSISTTKRMKGRSEEATPFVDPSDYTYHRSKVEINSRQRADCGLFGLSAVVKGFKTRVGFVDAITMNRGKDGRRCDNMGV